MSQAPNQITQWLERAAAQCGSPDVLRREAASVKDDNARKLLLEYCSRWEKAREAKA